MWQRQEQQCGWDSGKDRTQPGWCCVGDTAGVRGVVQARGSGRSRAQELGMLGDIEQGQGEAT